MLRWFRFITLSALVVFMQHQSEAASLKVSPAQFIVHHVEPGKLYDIHEKTGLRFTIFNDDEVPRTWTLTTYRPSERGRWEKGYGEIPDAKWCWFAEDEITVEPNGRAYAYLKIHIPPGDQYYNQHWIMTVHISGGGTGSVGVAVNIRVQIETKSSADTISRSAGLLGMRPSTVSFEDADPGTTREASVMLFNNDTVAHTYRVSPLFDDEAIKRKRYVTQTFSAIPDSGWLGRNETVHIEPGGTGALRLKLNVPDDPAHYGKKWEDMVLIQPDKGLPEFVRVQVETTTGPDAIE